MYVIFLRFKYAVITVSFDESYLQLNRRVASIFLNFFYNSTYIIIITIC